MHMSWLTTSLCKNGLVSLQCTPRLHCAYSVVRVSLTNNNTLTKPTITHTHPLACPSTMSTQALVTLNNLKLWHSPPLKNGAHPCAPLNSRTPTYPSTCTNTPCDDCHPYDLKGCLTPANHNYLIMSISHTTTRKSPTFHLVHPLTRFDVHFN